MEPAFQELESLVRQGQLDIIHISGPARGGTTPLEIAVTESGDGLIHEPFHVRRRNSFEEGCHSILIRVRELLEEKRAPIRLIVKDLAKYLDTDEWEHLLQLVRGVIFSIREPTQFFASIVSRRANEVRGDFRGDCLTEEEIRSLLNQIPREKYVDSSWNQLLKFLSRAEANHIPHCIVSNLALRADPVGAMEALRDRLVLGSIDIQRMATSWSVGIAAGFYVPPMQGYGQQDFQTLRESAWLKKTLSSDGFIPLNQETDGTKDLSNYPKAMEDHIIDEVIPMYFELMGHSSNLVHAHADVQLIVNRLAEVNAIEAYVIALHHRRHISGNSTDLNSTIARLEVILERNQPKILRKIQSIALAVTSNVCRD